MKNLISKIAVTLVCATIFVTASGAANAGGFLKDIIAEVQTQSDKTKSGFDPMLVNVLREIDPGEIDRLYRQGPLEEVVVPTNSR